MLESLMHDRNSFATLTYRMEDMPSSGSLVPLDAVLWLKRLRKLIQPSKVRYFLVGEYGELTLRPHFHAALFGLGPEAQEIVSESWSKGFVLLGDLTLQSAQYVAGYVTKKLTKKEDPKLCGRHPEFARMSLKPGIGAHAMSVVAEALSDAEGAKALASLGDVPVILQHGKRKLPLGRYLRRQLREELGFAQVGWQTKAMERFTQEMRDLRESTGTFASFKYLQPFIEWERIRQVEGRAEIFSKKGVI